MFSVGENLKLTAKINAYCALNIPLLAFVTPRVLELSESKAMVRIRLDRRTRNHLNVMYFGALAMGAELSVALQALQSIAEEKQAKVSFIFKDFNAEFLKRADGHTHFVCEQVQEVKQLVQTAALTDERVEAQFNGYAYVPSQSDEPVMRYQLTLSLKRKKKSI